MLLLVLASTGACRPPAEVAEVPVEQSEVLWDEWGVPHVYARNLEELGYGFGWAQVHSHGDALLRLYGTARGRGAEYWGADYLASDRLMHALGIPQSGPAALAAQPPAFRRYLQAFAAGINAYAEAHPEALADDVEAVLPVEAADVFRHGQRQLFTFASLTSNRPPIVQLSGQPVDAPLGSNTWAIGLSRSASGHAMLLQNPHLPWGEPLMRFYEAHLAGPGVNVYGATLLGMPGIAIGFNEHLGWSHTVNTVDVLDTYRLRLAGDGYLFDGAVRPFDVRRHVLRVRQSDGTTRVDTVVARRSVQGPVVQMTDSTAIAVRAPLLQRHGALRQWWDMGRARSLDAFEAVLERLQIPMFTVSYADRDGHIFYLFNGQVPDRAQGDYAYWQQAVPGDTRATLWTSIHDYSELPKVTDPSTGFLQNSNSPPWFATLPSLLLPSDYPAYMAPQWLLQREQRGLRMLLDDRSVTFDELVAMRYSNRMLLANRVLGDLLPAARRSEDALVREAVDVLARWDGAANAESRGALLFTMWVRAHCQGPVTNPCGFEQPWQPEHPLSTPRDLAGVEQAVAVLGSVAAQVQDQFGRLDVPWGEVMRLSDELPGNGAVGDPLGVFHVVGYAPEQEGTYRATFGDTWVAALEFTPDGPRGQVLLPYGNASQPGSPHDSDQLGLLARQEMRPLWFTRAEVEAHVEARTPIRYPGTVEAP